jgi:hypothetical protein
MLCDPKLTKKAINRRYNGPGNNCLAARTAAPAAGVTINATTGSEQNAPNMLPIG